MAARLMPTDPQRIVRALEVLESTGRSLADWQAQPGTAGAGEEETVRLLVLPDRGSARRRRIDARFDAMLAAGALEEVRRLLALGLSDGAADHAGARRGAAGGPLSRASCRCEAAAEPAKAETRQYAKRQLTWLRRNMIAWKIIDTQEMERI